MCFFFFFFFFFSSRRRHTRLVSDWSSDVCSSDLCLRLDELQAMPRHLLDSELHVLAGGEHVGLEVIPEHPRAAAHARNSRGSQIRPATADAATVYGEPR